MKRSKTKQFRNINYFTYIILILGSFFMLMPLVWLVRSSFMELNQIFIFPPVWIPEPFTFENYPGVFESVPFLKYFINTFTILIPSVIGILISCCMGAYAFSRLNWPYRDFVFAVLISAVGMRSFPPKFMKPAFKMISCSVISFLFWANFTLKPIRANSSIKVVS